MSDQDLFAGTWRMNPAASNFDPSHRPSEGTMRFEREVGGYLMRAEGVCEGKYIEEQPVRFVFDGKEHPVPGIPEVIAMSTRPNANTILVEAQRDGHTVGAASYVVSEDGATLTTSVRGIDAQQRLYQTTVLWARG